jgi:hypothetical protein
LMVNVRGLDVTAPGFSTVTLAVPGDAISVAEIEAVNWVVLIGLVGSEVPFHCTKELFTKPVPFTIKVNPADPAAAKPGDRLERAKGAAAFIVNVRVLEVTGPGFCTVTLAVPEEAIRPGPTVAVNWVALT